MRVLAAFAVALMLGLFQGQIAHAMPHHAGMHSSHHAHHEQSQQSDKTASGPSKLNVTVSGDANCPSHKDKWSDCCGYVCHSGAALFVAFQPLPETLPASVRQHDQSFLVSIPIYKLKRPPRY